MKHPSPYSMDVARPDMAYPAPILGQRGSIIRGNRSKAALTAVEASSCVPPFYPWHQGVKALSQGEQTAQELTWAAAWKDTLLWSDQLGPLHPWSLAVQESTQGIANPKHRKPVSSPARPSNRGAER